VLIYVMLGLLATQILMRYFLGSPPSWTEEVAITFFAWLVFLYATVGFREGFHVAIETIPPTWNRLRSASEIIVAVLVAGFGAVSFVAGIAYVQRTAGQKSAALQWPIEILYLAVPVCGFLLVLHAVAIVLERGVLTDRLPKSDL
jgi:TRAP-type C4-dicarboxylate transport system permease small subunit